MVAFPVCIPSLCKRNVTFSSKCYALRFLLLISMSAVLMRNFILRQLQLEKRAPPTSALHSALPPSLPNDGPLAQKQCVLFNTISSELRLLIYQAALADPHRLLHFLHVTPGYTRPTKLAHWRCDDEESPYLTWQHKCFGVWVEARASVQALVTRDASRSNSDLISLLLTCHLVYDEAVKVLYSENQFSFRGATGLSSLRTLVASDNWDALRSVHVSTTFLTPMKYRMEHREDTLPEDYVDWKDGCLALASLARLRLLRIDMIVWDEQDYFHRIAGTTAEHEALVFILGALKPVRAHTFEVELNIDLPDPVSTALGSLPFKILPLRKFHDETTFHLQ